MNPARAAGADDYAREQVRRREDGVRIALRPAVGEADRDAAPGAPVLEVQVAETFG